MEVSIQSIHFDINEKLKAFINKKLDKLEHRNPCITYAEFNLRVVKPETAMNKNVILKLGVPNQGDMVADKTADTFEEAVDKCLEAVEKQLEKLKDMK